MFDHIAELFSRIWSDIESHPSIGYTIAGRHGSFGVIGKLIGYQGIRRQVNTTIHCFCFFDQVNGNIQFVIFTK